MMAEKLDSYRKHYRSQQCRDLRHALIYRIGEDFPRLGGERIRACCADMILEEVFRVFDRKEHIRHGQVLWQAIAKEAVPARHRTTEQTLMRPVILTVSSAEDIERRLQGCSRREILKHKAVRLCQEAYEQDAVLSNCDLAEIFGENDAAISMLISQYEDEEGKVVPRRATVHDVGTGLTHKRIICLKRYREGKTSDRIAQETCHTIESVDRYLGQFDRVRCCRREGMDPHRTAHILNCSLNLVRQYLAIDDEILAYKQSGEREGGEGGGSGRNLEVHGSSQSGAQDLQTKPPITQERSDL